MAKEPIHVTDAEFEQTVLQSPIPVIVEFWAPWCNPCKMVAPILDKLALHNGGISARRRASLAVKGFESTAHYDTAIGEYLKKQAE